MFNYFRQSQLCKLASSQGNSNPQNTANPIPQVQIFIPSDDDTTRDLVAFDTPSQPAEITTLMSDAEQSTENGSSSLHMEDDFQADTAIDQLINFATPRQLTPQAQTSNINQVQSQTSNMSRAQSQTTNVSRAQSQTTMLNQVQSQPSKLNQAKKEFEQTNVIVDDLNVTEPQTQTSTSETTQQQAAFIPKSTHFDDDFNPRCSEQFQPQKPHETQTSTREVDQPSASSRLTPFSDDFTLNTGCVYTNNGSKQQNPQQKRDPLSSRCPQGERVCSSSSNPPIFSSSWQLEADFDDTGGSLQGKQSEVVLLVPEDAVGKGTRRHVTSAICTDVDTIQKRMGLLPGEHIVTPLVEYQVTEPLPEPFLKPVQVC